MDEEARGEVELASKNTRGGDVSWMHGDHCSLALRVSVRDLGVSTHYWMDVLGFQKDRIDAPGWSFLTRDAFRVMLGECPNERSAGELGDHSYFAYWNVEGVDDLFQEFAAKGALISSPPSNKPWGLREFGLRTPDGHRITCGEEIG